MRMVLECVLVAALLCVIAAHRNAAAQIIDEFDVNPPSDTIASLDAAADTTVRDTVPEAEYIQKTEGPKKPGIIRRAYNYREQLGLALGMMAFVVVIFTTTQNWNPE